MDELPDGLYQVYNDAQLSAVLIRQGRYVGFTETCGMINRDSAFYTAWADITPSATFRRLNSPTLTEAVEAFIENRAPRWKN